MIAEKPREYYNREAATQFNAGQRLAQDAATGLSLLSHLTRGILQVSQGKWEDAGRAFDTILLEKPTNIPALLGKVGNIHSHIEHTLTTSSRLSSRTHAVNIPKPSSSSNACYSLIPTLYLILE